MTVQTGIDRVAVGDAETLDPLRGKRVGLLAHPASVDRRLVHSYRVLLDADVNVVALFGPEHGFAGAAQDMISVSTDATTDGVAIHSLYGESFEDLSPRAEQLEGLDAVVVDLQDVGSRYYTYVWSAALMLRACAKAGVQTVVLDRPNPLGGVQVEGAPIRPGYRSFVGLYDVSVRHGLTIGEICTMVRQLESIDDAALTVVPMVGWTRDMYFDQTGLPWVLPSPNMPTLDTALVYPGGCLLEGTNLSDGRGTTRPFELFGAPFVRGPALAELAVDGATLRPVTIEPTFHKHARLACGGVQVHVTDRALFRPYETYLRLIARAHALSDGQFCWRTERYEYVDDKPAIDLLTGGPEYRTAVESDALSVALEHERLGAEDFATAREAWLLYPTPG